ncbi:MAG: IS200/IS605 family transposase [bacterium]
MAVVRSNHCAFDTHYHIVFPVKYRKALLTPVVTKAIRDIAGDIAERYDIVFEQLGTDQNHIHILCSFHPKYSGGDVVRMFKSITAKQLFERFPELKKDLWGGEFWADGYYIATVSTHGDWTTVERYVANQGKTSGQPTQLTIL